MSKIIDSSLLSKGEIIDHLDSEKKPIIFWDTCALLDIIRLPVPERNHPRSPKSHDFGALQIYYFEKID